MAGVGDICRREVAARTVDFTAGKRGDTDAIRRRRFVLAFVHVERFQLAHNRGTVRRGVARRELVDQGEVDGGALRGAVRLGSCDDALRWRVGTPPPAACAVPANGPGTARTTIRTVLFTESMSTFPR